MFRPMGEWVVVLGRGFRSECPRPLSGCPRLILANTPLTTSKTQPITTRPRSIRPMLVVFNEGIQKGVGGIPRYVTNYTIRVLLILKKIHLLGPFSMV